MSIATDGYLCVSKCVDDKTLDALRTEADHLFRLKSAQDALSEDDYFNKVYEVECLKHFPYHDGRCHVGSPTHPGTTLATLQITVRRSTGIDG